MLMPVILMAQTVRITQLRNELYTTKDHQHKLSVLLSLLREGRSVPSDSLVQYIEMAEGLIKPDSPEYYKLNTYRAFYLLRNGNQNSALLLLNELLSDVPKNNSLFFDVHLGILHARANAFVRNNLIKNAIQDGFTMLKMAEENNSDNWKARAYLILGYSDMELLKYKSAIENLKKCYSYLRNDSIIFSSIYVYSNLASCYNNLGQMDSAFKYIDLAIKYGNKFENLSSLSNSLNIRADMYIRLNQPELAEKDLEEALKLRKQVGDVSFIVSDMAQMAKFYASIGQTNKGIEWAHEGIKIAREKKLLSKQIYLLTALAENYRVAGQKDEYANALLEIVELKDTLYQKNAANDLAALEAKYQLQKKENIIIRQESKLARNRFVTYSAIAVLTFIFIAFGLLYRNAQLIRQRKFERKLMEQQVEAKADLNKAMEAERRRIAADLHDNLGAYAAAITNQVKFIKDKAGYNNAITENLEENAGNMVAQLSDTIWVLKNQELNLTNLYDRLKLWVQKLMKSYPGVNYNFKENIEKEYNFTPVNALHIFYILTECVNNALKHSGCSQIEVSFKSDEKVEICVSDDGKGMTEKPPNGNGLEHIKQRALACKWNVNWYDRKPQGTIIILSNTTNEVYNI